MRKVQCPDSKIPKLISLKMIKNNIKSLPNKKLISNDKNYKKLYFFIMLLFLFVINLSYSEAQTQSDDSYKDNVQLINLNAKISESGETKGYIVEFETPTTIEEYLKIKDEIDTKEKNLAESPAIYRYTIGAITLAYDKYKFKTDINNHRKKIVSDHQQLFRDDKNKNIITGQLANIIGFATKSENLPKVLDEFTDSFNGVFVDLDPKELEKIKESNLVKAVRPNRKFDPLLEQSVPLINADDVWQLVDDNGINLKGNGISVSVIDTGIDYTHFDLGGCIGNNCKVKGGYDFVNNDNDPMDDVGHGTHVAGIIAADGTLKGVAPNAKLYAYKVCSPTGCWEDDILAAIEYSTDPNQDGNFDDRLDIISMSLGGRGDPDDPLSTAVDNAVDLGVVSVIAAGNSGPGYNTIGSPGTARKAITVAASDKSDVIAGFSSRGPTIIGTIKPDITAPGVAIRSTLPRNTYDSYSGTSMATPHVSGVAALLLQKYPGLGPGQVKAVIVNNGVDLGYDSFTQGSGRIDALKVINAPLLITPTSFGFIINSNTNSFSNIFKVKLEELISGQTINFGIEAKVDDNNMLASVNPNSLMSLGESSLTISFTTKDGGNFKEGTYSGSIIFKNQNLNLKVIFSLIIDYTPPKIINPHVEHGLIGNQFGQNFVWRTDDSSETTLLYRKVGSNAFMPYTSLGKEHIFDLVGLDPGEYEYYIEATNSVGLKSRYDDNGGYFKFTVLQSEPIPSEGYSKVSDISRAIKIVTRESIDFDGDGKKEFVIRKDVGNTWITNIDIYENTGGNNFQVASSINIPGFSSYYPSDFSDGDNDGLKELLIYGRTSNDFYTKVYESTSPNGYPTNLAWQSPRQDWWQVGAKIVDTDKDGKNEIVVAGQLNISYIHGIDIYENIDDNSYQLTYSTSFPGIYTSQSMEVAEDIDRDGKAEILFGGLIPSSSKIYMIENNGDNTYQQIWSGELRTDDGQIINVQEIVDVGDLDNDGKKEFISGGLETRSAPSVTYWRTLYLFEYVSDNNFVPIWSIKISGGVSDDLTLNIGDLDNDKKNEIIINVGSNTYIFENVGDNLFKPAWYSNQISTNSIGVLDYDNDGYDEIIVSGAIYKKDISLVENCEILGDEDGNGLADCADTTACPNGVYCDANHSTVCKNSSCVEIKVYNQTNQTGTLNLSSIPEGTSIYIDDDNINYGYTNKNITLPVGNHFVVLTKFGYNPSTRTNFTINPNEVTNVFMTLSKEFKDNQTNQTGILSISSIPDGAAIYIDDDNKNYGYTNRDITLSPGDHYVVLTKLGYIPTPKKYFAINPGQVTNVVLILSKESADNQTNQTLQTGILALSSNPEGATIYIDNDNKNYEYTNKNITLLVGNHFVVLTKFGYNPSLRTNFAIDSEKVTNLFITLTKEFKDNQTNQTCSSVSDGICPANCAAGSDYDCCINTGKCWNELIGCSECKSVIRKCSNISDVICPDNCMVGSDIDCCNNAGMCWLEGKGCYDTCNFGVGICNPDSVCSTIQDNCCPVGCAAGSDADCCNNAGKCWRQGQGCYNTC